MASSQHRRVFVGNIPYGATEEQLIQICEEVGPVVSFRLVVDRETGKPKGYGFCEYKDEETALSARRNLQGYEINGRQLRVDFAENDKGSERNREQGRGGPGVAVNADLIKQVGGPAVALDATLNQQAGLHLAMTAASVMAGALGTAQAAGPSNSNGPPQQPLPGNDPLTAHLAKMSKSQLIQVMSEMKVLATQNYDLARQLLVVCPQLPKALFQAQIMLGMVTPQMLQMPNIRQASAQGNHQSQQSAPTNIHSLPPMAPLTSTPKNSLVSNQFSAPMQFPTQVRAQAPNLAHIGAPQENLNPVHSVANTLPSALPQHLGGMSSGPPMTTTSMSLRPVQAPLLHNARLSGPGNGIQPSVLGGSMPPGSGFQTGSLVRPVKLEANSYAASVGDGTWAKRMNPDSRNDSAEPSGRPLKLVKLEDGGGSTFSGGNFPVSTASNSKLPNAAAGIGSVTARQRSRADEPQNSVTQAPQLQLPPALIEQLKNLTPEQLSKLSPEEQQQVLQLQKMFN